MTQVQYSLSLTPTLTPTGKEIPGSYKLLHRLEYDGYG